MSSIFGFSASDLSYQDVAQARFGYLKTSMEAAGRRKPENEKEAQKLMEMCREFESIFLAKIMEAMRKTVNKSGLIDGGHAEKIFESLLDMERSRVICQNHSFGLAIKFYEQLSKNL